MFYWRVLILVVFAFLKFPSQQYELQPSILLYKMDNQPSTKKCKKSKGHEYILRCPDMKLDDEYVEGETPLRDIVVSRTFVEQCPTIRDVIADCDTNAPMVYNMIPFDVMQYIIAYFEAQLLADPELSYEKSLEYNSKTHLGNPKLEDWQKIFIDEHFHDDDPEKVFNLLQMRLRLLKVTDFIGYCDLMHTIGRSIAQDIEGKTTQEMRDYFRVKGDITPDEEAALRKEDKWFDPDFDPCAFLEEFRKQNSETKLSDQYDEPEGSGTQDPECSGTQGDTDIEMVD